MSCDRPVLVEWCVGGGNEVASAISPALGLGLVNAVHPAHRQVQGTTLLGRSCMALWRQLKGVNYEEAEETKSILKGFLLDI